MWRIEKVNLRPTEEIPFFDNPRGSSKRKTPVFGRYLVFCFGYGKTLTSEGSRKPHQLLTPPPRRIRSPHRSCKEVSTPEIQRTKRKYRFSSSCVRKLIRMVAWPKKTKSTTHLFHPAQLSLEFCLTIDVCDSIGLYKARDPYCGNETEAGYFCRVHYDMTHGLVIFCSILP